MGSIFGEARQQGPAALLSMKAGKMELSGKTVTPDKRKGLLVLRKADDGLMHLVWKDRGANTVEDDLIIFQGDATLKHLPQCKDGFAMLLEFTTGRRIFFWSQEPRKKGTGWEKENISKEMELLDKANDILNGNTPAPAAAPAALGFGGMTHSELLAMLSGGAGAAAAPAPAAAATPAVSAPSPAAAEPAAEPAAAPSESTAAAPAAAAPAPAPAAAAFSAADISNILGGLTPAAPAPAAPSAPAAGPFSSDAISNILSNIGAPAAPPIALNAVLSPEATAAHVDAGMEARLREHLPPGADADSVAETLSTPQLQQAALRFTEALHSGDAGGLIAELGINPAGLGVEPFLRALQAATPAAAPASSDAMDTSDAADAPAPDKMEE